MKPKVMLRGSILGLVLGPMLGCSWFPTFDEVMPDRNKEYQKSASLPDLEIPPDLSADSISDTLSVPDVDARGVASYSTYQERIARRGDERSTREPDSDRERYRKPAAEPGTTEESTPEESPEETEVPAREEEEVAVVEEEPSTEDEEEPVESEDATYSEPAEDETAETDAGPQAEAESEPESENDATALDAAEDEVEEEKEPDRKSTPAAATVAEIGRKRTAGLVELVSAGAGKKYLRITEDFSKAWQLTGQALVKAGFTVEDEDQERGVYFLDFAGSSGTAAEEAGFWSSLAFWRGDRTEHEVQLTGIGEKTEVVVLDQDGNWEGGPVADEILSRLETALNQTTR